MGFLKANAVGLGTTDTTGRNAGVGTATGTIIYNVTDNAAQVWTGSSWSNMNTVFTATGGTKIPSATSGNGYIYHVFLLSQIILRSRCTNPFFCRLSTFKKNK